jgi:hypothetical protein
MPEVIIFHNPACGTSRHVQAVLELLPRVGKPALFRQENGEVIEDTGVRRA